MLLNDVPGALPEQLQTPAVPARKPRRNHRSAKKAGALFEQQTAAYIADRLDDDRIERRVMGGVNDRGDISNVRTIRGGRVVIEAKSYSSDRIEIRRWLNEASAEAANDDAAIGVVVVKVRGTANPAEQLVCMSLAQFVDLLEGGAPKQVEY